MAYKYINPGIAELFDEVSPNHLQFTGASKLYSRTNGYCFSTAGIPQALYLERGKEYWLAMGVRFSNSANDINLCFIDAPQPTLIKNFSNWLRIESKKFDGTRMTFKISYKDAIIYESEESISIGTLYWLEFYVKDDPETGRVKIWVDGKNIIDFEGKTGEGNGFNRLEMISLKTYYDTLDSVTAISDIIVQNTGKIGDMKIKEIPCGAGTCEWEVAYPVGFMIASGDYMQTVKTYIFTNQMFTQAGKVKCVRVSQRGANPVVFKFCLFRKNQESGKYSATQVTKELATTLEGEQELVLSKPLEVEAGDYFGFYISGNLHYLKMNNACLAFNNIDATNVSECDIFSQASSYDHAPSVHAVFLPEEQIEGYRKACLLPKNLLQYVSLTTNELDKNIFVQVETEGMQLGKIDCILITASAYYEGDSAVTSLSPLVGTAADMAVGEKMSMATKERTHILGVYEQNPLTCAPWKLSALDEIRFGVQSKS